MSLYNNTIAIVIPCFNVEKHIKQVVDNIPEYVDSIILINDSSPDKTGAVLSELAAGNSKITILTHSENQGVGGAMITGFKEAIEQNIDLVVKLDGDGQMDTSKIHLFVEALVNDDYDFAKGNRFHDLKTLRKMPAIRRFGNLGLSFLIKAASGYWHIFDPTNGFFCVKSQTLKSLEFSSLSKRFFFESSLLINLYYTGAKIKDIALPAIYGNEVSNLSITKTIFTFPHKLLKAFFKRILLRYFIYDFNINSFYIFFGGILFLFGMIFGITKWIHYSSLGMPSPTGTIMIAVISLVLGFQMLLSATQYDISSKNPFENKK